jgi:hypothetical protein
MDFIVTKERFPVTSWALLAYHRLEMIAGIDKYVRYS